jgi:hypothetical protein
VTTILVQARAAEMRMNRWREGVLKLAIVVSAEQIGMTEVVKDFLEQKNRETHNSPGLSVRYTFDAQPAKGLLLNKKVE